MRAKTKNLSQQTHSNMFLLLTWKHNIWMHSKNRWTFTARVPPQTPMILILWASNPTDPARSSQNISNGPSLCHYAMYHKIPYKKKKHRLPCHTINIPCLTSRNPTVLRSHLLYPQLLELFMVDQQWLGCSLESWSRTPLLGFFSMGQAGKFPARFPWCFSAKHGKLGNSWTSHESL